MSVDWLSRAWVTETGSPSRKAVLIALADRCDQDGVCWPSFTDIVTRTELSRSTVERAIADLQVDSVIQAWDRSRPDGSNTSKGFRLLIEPITARPRHGDVGGAASDVGGHVTMTGRTEPSVEPSGNRKTGRSSRPSRKSTWQTREADDPTGSTSDEPPALGAAPRKTTVERKETAARGKTTYALGLRMKMALSSAFAAPVNERAFAQQTKAWGLPIDELSAMVDVFIDNPRRYLKGDEVPWIGFIRQREVLRADAAKVMRASAPASDYAEGL